MMKNLKREITDQNEFVSCIAIKHFLHIKSCRNYIEKKQRLFVNEKLHSMNLYVYFCPIEILDISYVKAK